MSMEPSETSPKARLLRTILWGTVILVIAGVAISWALDMYLGNGSKTVRYSGEADIRSEFSLTDHTGQEVTQADYTYRWQLVFFGFTNCPDICPTTLAYMASVVDLLGEDADQVAPIFITVDPERDTVPVMAEYVSVFHPSLIGLTGTEAQVAEATRNFRTWYERTEDDSAPDGYFMAHAGHIYLMQPSGEFEAVYQEGGQPPEALAQEIRKKL
ncbi:SCO family protein [Salipiger marinus]|uniref:Protein SCO1/2 n=1 Tax=Paracoccus isoporae TaxID=591205 RepID=A0A1G7FPY4_9RHOB|nr:MULTISPECIES: SCO family protein [Rhodobacterales]MEB3421784.1 SCO family protein [Salipiger manganoxidans]SDE77993.1 protein SCO1/2 [Paracoccus isoporae]